MPLSQSSTNTDDVADDSNNNRVKFAWPYDKISMSGSNIRDSITPNLVDKMTTPTMKLNVRPMPTAQRCPKVLHECTQFLGPSGLNG